MAKVYRQREDEKMNLAGAVGLAKLAAEFYRDTRGDEDTAADVSSRRTAAAIEQLVELGERVQRYLQQETALEEAEATCRDCQYEGGRCKEHSKQYGELLTFRENLLAGTKDVSAEATRDALVAQAENRGAARYALRVYKALHGQDDGAGQVASPTLQRVREMVVTFGRLGQALRKVTTLPIMQPWVSGTKTKFTLSYGFASEDDAHAAADAVAYARQALRVEPVLDACERGHQQCHVCPRLGCCDNQAKHWTPDNVNLQP